MKMFERPLFKKEHKKTFIKQPNEQQLGNVLLLMLPKVTSGGKRYKTNGKTTESNGG